MNIISIASISLISVFLIIILREVNPTYILPISVVLCSLLLICIYPMINELFVYSKDLMDTAVNSDSIKILYKAIGSAFIIQYASDLSRDCGVESIASKLEIVGRIYIISLCIPLVKELISTVNNF